MNDEIVALETELRSIHEKLQKLRRSAPAQVVEDYSFVRPDGSSVTLDALFGDKDDLLVVHNMGRSCVYCTLWADGFNGLSNHLSDRAAFVLVSPDEPEVQGEFAASRGWTFPTASSAGSSFALDMGFEKDGVPLPGASAFHKQSDGSIVRTGKAYFGPGDEFCSAWHLFDLLPGGPGSWQPKYVY